MMNGVNLIPVQRLAAQRRRKRLRAWVATAIVHSGLIVAACIGARALWDNSDTATAAELTQYGQHISQLNSKLADLRKQLVESETSRRTAVSIIDQPDWSILLSILGQTVGDDVVLRGIDLKPDSAPATSAKPQAQPIQNFNLQLRGFALNQPAVSQFVLRLQQIKLFDEVKLQRTGREAVNNAQAVNFDIACTIHSSGGRQP